MLKMKNYNEIFTDDLSLVCEICHRSELELIAFGSINKRVICDKCIQEHNLKDIDNILDNQRSERIDKLAKEIYKKIDSEYEVQDDEKYDAEELHKVMEYTNIILTLKNELSRELAIHEILQQEINNIDSKLVQDLDTKIKFSDELLSKIERKKNLLLKISRLGVYQGISHYKFFK